MPTIDVTGAPDRLLDYQNILRSHCLMYASRAIRNGEPPLNWAGLTTAWDCWQHNAGDKHTSRDVPKGFPAFLGVKRGDDDGDVIISRGDGTFAATDHPWGEVGICTLAERETETGRKFVGWAGELFGYTLTSTGTASLDLERIIEKEDDTMLRFITRDSTSPWFATDGLTKRYLSPGEDQLLVDLGLAVREADGKPKLLGAKLELIPDAVRVVSPDPAAIAAALAPLLPQPVAEATLLTAIVPAIAKAVNDDAAARLAV